MACVILLIALTANVFGQGAARPNILVIMVDDLGYGDLSGYGARDVRTPHLDALASSGIRFSRFYANAPVCSPTRAALLTGQYPDLAGVPGVIRTHANKNWGWLSPNVRMLPVILKRGGYHTAIVGKWHLGLTSPDTPTERGFDFFHGFLGDMMDDYYNHLRHGNNYMRLNGRTIDPQGHATDLFTQWAIDYLATRKDRPQPFFLYLAYNAPHDPIQPPKGWLEKVKQREAGIGDKRAALVALIEHMDDGVGKVLSALKANGQDRNTLIVFTSDNGGALNQGANNNNLRGGKEDLYEGGIRVPMFAVWPGKIATGAATDRVALTMDLYPTLCEAAGVKTVSGIDGISILPVLLGRPASEEQRYLFWMRREGGHKYFGQDYYAVRRGPWKLMHNSPFEPYQLFNLETDPAEQRDLSREEPRVFQELIQILEAHLQRAGAVPWQKPPAEK